ncbi:MAG: phosphoserine aminotransferase [Cytophagaceae bacterium SCN 52-12]|nr:MAG: phosphoserine aminotransferase [Cytophagaceae bacterium SCN 52-12]
MITFYPGPSRLYPQIEAYLGDAYHSGLLSMNHRSQPFMKMLSAAIAGLKEKLMIPEAYEVIFVSSATECWEIIAQSLTSRTSYHIYNGAFGKKWKEYAHKIHGRAEGIAYQLNEQPQWAPRKDTGDDILCLTHTETSNGTAIADSVLSSLRASFNGLIAVDATSSMAGVALPWMSADVWYASVQKCFGLPSGLGVMVLSPRAAERTKRIGEDAHYNSLEFVLDNFRKFQTPYTPNILGIYLLGRLMDSLEPVGVTAGVLTRRGAGLYGFLAGQGFELPVREAACRSMTVITVEAERSVVAGLKAFALERGIVLGNGYGEKKETTFRIANFPAIPDAEFEILKECLLNFKTANRL